MADSREFDILVFGATGFAGKYATEYLFKSGETSRWGVAGRSLPKLQALVSGLRVKYPDRSEIPSVVVADALEDAETLRATFARTRVVLNFAGPYTRIGRAVVEAAVNGGAHYVDISGEPGHILGTMVRLHERAEREDVLVVSGCGFGYAIADIGGYVMLTDKLRAKAAEMGVTDPKISVEMFTKTVVGPAGYCMHTGTLDSLMAGIRASREMSRFMRKIRAELKGNVSSYKPKFGFGIGREPRLGPGSPVVCVNDSDMFAVRRSMMLVDMGRAPDRMMGSDSVAFKSYFHLGTWKRFVKMAVGAIGCAFMALVPGGRRLVLRFPGFFTFGLFSRNGPTEEQVKNTTVEITGFGRAKDADGKDVAQAVVKGTSPEPAYLSTTRIAVAAAFTILEERHKLPKGGVLTPAVAFYGSDIVDRMRKMGAVEFDFVSP